MVLRTLWLHETTGDLYDLDIFLQIAHLEAKLRLNFVILHDSSIMVLRRLICRSDGVETQLWLVVSGTCVDN